MDSKLLFSGLNCIDCKGFKQLLDTQSLVDCTLACEGGKISAHKLVLSACSSYLAKILLDHPVEHPIIILPELNIEDVRTLVHYMYTGELLKSDTVNSISLLRTAAILSINSLNDLLLSSTSSSPSNLINSHQFTNGNNTSNNNNSSNGSTTRLPPTAQSLQQDRPISIVDQISPLLAAISQQQQQSKLHHQAFGTNSSNNTNSNNNINANTDNNASFGGFPLNQNENISRNLSVSSHDSNSSTTSSNFSSIIGAAAAAAVTSVNGSGAGAGSNTAGGIGANSAVAQFYNSLTNGTINNATTNAAILTSSSSSTTPSPMNNKLNFNVPEPFSYSSAITGMVTVTSPSNNNSGNPSGPQSSVITNEFQFKCPVCQNHFQTICSFEYHMQRAHSVTSFGCEICHKPFASLRYVLTDHMRRCHGWKGATNTAAGSQNNHNKSDDQDRQQQQQQQQQHKLHC